MSLGSRYTGISEIYTEKIHRVECIKCRQQCNTNDISHELSKGQAAKSFQVEGWVFIYGEGWLCKSCKPRNPAKRADKSTIYNL
jgi:hypothetical protein